jgi:hypothetical protein
VCGHEYFAKIKAYFGVWQFILDLDYHKLHLCIAVTAIPSRDDAKKVMGNVNHNQLVFDMTDVIEFNIHIIRHKQRQRVFSAATWCELQSKVKFSKQHERE